MPNNLVGLLHPGEMGASIGAAARTVGQTVYWAGQGRSPASLARAARAGLVDAGSLAELCQRCGIIVSVCPPDAAEALAREVLAAGFRGLYMDLNAIAPQRAQSLAEAMRAAGNDFVDGGIIGGPAWQPGTVLYLSGPDAGRAAECFAGSPLETVVLGDEVGKASALKMCFSAFSKGSTALLCGALAAAEGLGVRAALEAQWDRDGSGFAAQAQNRVRRSTAKAWRFAGEMEEIAATFEGAGLPGGFHAAAAEVFGRMAGFKEAETTPALEAVLSAILKKT